MATLERAIAIASEAHAGQVDKAGEPYILHPLRLMMMMKEEKTRIVAVLHDVVEDTADKPSDQWSFERLVKEGFSEEILSALACVTKLDKNEDYERFIGRVLPNPVAREVKIADLEDNMNMLRMSSITTRDLQRLEKYHRARARLLAVGTSTTANTGSSKPVPLTSQDISNIFERAGIPSTDTTLEHEGKVSVLTSMRPSSDSRIPSQSSSASPPALSREEEIHEASRPLIEAVQEMQKHPSTSEEIREQFSRNAGSLVRISADTSPADDEEPED